MVRRPFVLRVLPATTRARASVQSHSASDPRTRSFAEAASRCGEFVVRDQAPLVRLFQLTQTLRQIEANGSGGRWSRSWGGRLEARLVQSKWRLAETYGCGLEARLLQSKVNCAIPYPRLHLADDEESKNGSADEQTQT